MAIETPSATPTSAPLPDESPIENELATYRAIAPSAVASLIFGVAAVFSFADYRFLIAAGLAIGFGVLALLKLRRQPEALTGGGMARVGIALGLGLGLSAVTFDFVSNWLVARDAERFVRGDIVTLLNDRDFDGTLWYKMPPDERRGMTPEQTSASIKSSLDSDPMRFDSIAGSLSRVIETRLRPHKEAAARFDRIEKSGYDGMTPFAVALVRIEGAGPLPKDLARTTSGGTDPDRPDYLGVVMKRAGTGDNQAWWVSDYLYPYNPESYREAPVKIDDGHDH